VLLAHTYRWLQPEGVLVLVVPAEHVRECGDILASHFKDVSVYRLTEPEAVRYRQVVVLARRRTRREREQLRDDDIILRRAQFASVGQQYGQFDVLADGITQWYAVPESGPVKMELSRPSVGSDRGPASTRWRTAKQRESSFPSLLHSKGAR
jgi:hypothetical protein